MSACLAYRLTFPNGKQYVGVANNMAARLRSHRHNARHGARTPLYTAMRKYGPDSVQCEVLVVGDRQYILDVERRAIAAFETRAPAGYNLTAGGDESPAHLPSVREKIRQARLKDWQNPAYREKITASATGRVMTPEQNRKNSRAKTEHWRKPAYRDPIVAIYKTLVWITDGSTTRRVRNTDPIPTGWRRGRHNGH